MGLWRDRSWLEAQYIDSGLSIREVAGLAGCSHVTVLRQLREFGIVTRDRTDSYATRRGKSLLYQDREWLSEQITNGLTSEQIAGFCGVTNVTIKHWRAKFGFSERPYKDALWLWQRYFCDGMSIAEIARFAGVAEGTIQDHLQKAGFYTDKVSMRPSAEALSFLRRQLGNRQAVAEYLGVSFYTLAEWCGDLDTAWCVPQKLQDKEWLHQQYTVYERSAASIASNLQCSHSAVIVWLEKHGIPIRTSAEVRTVCGKQFRGENNPSYIDGRHDFPYSSGFKKVVSPRILDRDNRTCQICGATDCL